MRYERRWNDGEWDGLHVEDVLELAKRRRPPDAFDFSCLRLNTAIRAIWLLYRRAKWGLLAELGLPRARYEAAFRAYDDRYVFSDHGYLRLDEQVEKFASCVPAVREAANVMLRRYEDCYPEEVKTYYRKVVKIMNQLEGE